MTGLLRRWLHYSGLYRKPIGVSDDTPRYLLSLWYSILEIGTLRVEVFVLRFVIPNGNHDPPPSDGLDCGTLT